MRSVMSTLIIAFVLTASASFAQSYVVPKDYKLVNKEDYAPYNSKVVEGINWLENTPITSAPITRKEAYTFLMDWITGSPDVTIAIDANNISYCKDNPDLLFAYMGGWTKYAIEHPGDTSVAKGNLAGMRSIIKVYKKNARILKPNKDLTKLVAASERGELEKFLMENAEN